MRYSSVLNKGRGPNKRRGVTEVERIDKPRGVTEVERINIRKKIIVFKALLSKHTY